MTKKISFEKLNSSDPQVRYKFLQELISIASKSPEILYKDIDKISELLESENKIIKWTGIELIGYLSSVDTENKTDKFVDRLIQFLHSGQLIISNHAIFALGFIAQNKPKFRKKIIKEFLQIEHDKFKTEDCKNISIGKVLDAFKQLLPFIGSDTNVVEFIVRANTNDKKSTQKRAEELITKLLVI